MSAALQKPTGNLHPTSFGEAFWIAAHPAFRLGFLDAQAGRPFDHEDILSRIRNETPASALARLDWNDRPLDPSERGRLVEISQYRYEEGRKLQVEFGLKCRGWNHPDYPPAQVMDWLRNRFSNKRAA